MAVKSAMSVSGSIQKEREALSNIGRCPNIIYVSGMRPPLVRMEFGSGGTLADLIKKSGESGLSESEPENILLVPNKNGVGAKFKVKIGDFGLAKRAKQNKKRKLDPYWRGTPIYLSPEVVTDCIQEPPLDIWALGCIVLEIVTEKPPWFTADMLLNHSYLEGLVDDGVDDDEDDNDEVEEGDEILVSDEVDSSLMLFESDEE
ncbi:mitogen-activated protein kinase kinase kinase 20-like [Actinidia eriantha]|uniref:mitogen-activated protein kinase kinase kinase 20-like n=1 Tax=Actinidia eriantha TaxID=165200 RepID=UPI002583EC98|nr:mitogen-activated protein kinase kinase kinase 20-like [Actinidia eriantha]